MKRYALLVFAGVGFFVIAADALAQSRQSHFAYIANRDSGDVSGYVIDPNTGSLTPVPGSPFPADVRPVSVVVDPTGKFAYVANQGNLSGIASGIISAYTVDANTGSLTPIAGSPFQVPCCIGINSLAIDPRGRFLYASISVSTFGAVAGFVIDANSGALTPVTGSPFTVGGAPTSITLSPNGKFAYMQAFAGNIPSVFGFAIDPSTGSLSPVPGSPSPGGQSGSLSSITIDRLGKHAYVPDPSNGVLAFAIDGTTGALTPTPGSPFPASIAISVTLDPTGKFAYVIDNSCSFPPTGAVIGFSVDVSSGTLAQIGSPFPGGNCLQSMTMHPTGKFLYVADNPNSVLGYSIDGATGTLSAAPGSPFQAGSGLIPLTIDSSGRFAYITGGTTGALSGTPGVSAFVIDPITGTLTPAPGSPFPTGTNPQSVTLTPGPVGQVPPLTILTVASTNPTSGAAITVSPLDNNGLSSGSTQFTRNFNNGVLVALGATASAGGQSFSSWTGCDSTSGATCTVTMNTDRTVIANYVPPTGTIVVTTNLSAAAFTVTGPTTFSGSGTSATFSNAPVGAYTMTFVAVADYIAPAPQTQTLAAGGTLTFTGTYDLAVGSLDVTTNTDSATFTITGPVTLSGNGESASFTNLPPGSYAISYGPACRSDLPVSETKTVLPASKTVFIGTYAPGFLKFFPLAGLNPCTTIINAVFDHSQRAPYSNDHKVVAYTGETGLCDANSPPQDFQSVVGVKHPHSGYRNQAGSPFDVNGNYTGGENGRGSPTLTCTGISSGNLPSKTFLFYDGHPGYDFKASCGTNVYAAVSGTVIYPVSIPGLRNAVMFHVLELHPDAPNSGYSLYYLHLSTYPGNKYPSCDSAPPVVPPSCNGKPCHVNAGQLIGMSGDAGVPGSPHLHFEIQLKPGVPVDPYGWKGAPGADPYKRASNINLWP